MRYVGNVSSGDESSKTETLNDSKPSIDRVFPGSTALSPGFITGTIENISPNYGLRVVFYIGKREGQELILLPLQKLYVKHQPCERIQIRGINGTLNYGVFRYTFRINVADTAAEINELLYRSEFEISQIDIQSLFLDQADVRWTQDTGTTPILLTVQVPAYTELLIKRLWVNAGTDTSEGLDINWSAYVLVQWSAAGEVPTNVIQHRLSTRGQKFIDYQNWFGGNIKRDITKNWSINLIVQPSGDFPATTFTGAGIETVPINAVV